MRGKKCCISARGTELKLKLARLYIQDIGVQSCGLRRVVSLQT
jgi:hypothetical protein